MWPNTKITELLAITLPLIQAPMAGGATTSSLVASVSNAGGLGSLGAGYLSANDLKAAIKQIKQLTSKPFSVNLFIPEKPEATDLQIKRARDAVQASCQALHFEVALIKPPFAPLFEEQMHVILEEKVPIFTFAFGVLSDYWIKICKRNRIKLIGTATTLEEAKLLENSGIDAIAAQGSEAGGHRGTFIGQAENALIDTVTLVQQLAAQINIPLIAAGGIMRASEIIGTLKLGASGVQMGTAFLCCPESGIHPSYKKLLFDGLNQNTALTRAFSGKLARGIPNQFMSNMLAHQKDILDYPIQNTLTSSMRKEARQQNNTDFMSMWAGQSNYRCQDLPAAVLIQKLNDEVMALLAMQ
jgi:nitronate monooxygenase